MAARMNRRHQEMVREKIQASQLINRLEDHILGEVDMNTSQVNAALGLLRKVLPDLKATDTTLMGPDGKNANIGIYYRD